MNLSAKPDLARIDQLQTAQEVARITKWQAWELSNFKVATSEKFKMLLQRLRKLITLIREKFLNLNIPNDCLESEPGYIDRGIYPLSFLLDNNLGDRNEY
jgi:uncharacterized SAM-dependent methyltransferase